MAGKFFGKVFDFIGLEESSLDEEQGYDDYDDGYSGRRRSEKSSRYEDDYEDYDDYGSYDSQRNSRREDYDDGYEDYDDYEEEYEKPQKKSASKLRGFGKKKEPAPARSYEPERAGSTSAFVPGKMKMVIYQPMSYDDAQLIIDHLRNRKPIVVNLVDLEVEVAQRILDFMSGAVYAVNGNIQRVAKGIFILAPSNVDISGNIGEEMPGSGYYTLGSHRSSEY